MGNNQASAPLFKYCLTNFDSETSGRLLYQKRAGGSDRQMSSERGRKWIIPEPLLHERKVSNGRDSGDDDEYGPTTAAENQNDELRHCRRQCRRV